MAYIKIYSGSSVEVQHVKQLLQEQEIEPIIKDQANSASLAGFGAVMPNFQEVYVHKDQEAQSIKTIEHL